MGDIAVVINNRNRLGTTKAMVEKLLSLNSDERILIIDNDSTYEPLLEWYETIESKVDIRYCPNEGHLALWSTGIYKELGRFFVYTDSDLVLNENFPKDWKTRMFEAVLKYEKKVGLALCIDDLPDHYRYKNQVIRNEARWWYNEIDDDVFEADTDTTFFMMENIGQNKYESVRMAHEDMVCRHAPWYIDLDNLDEEEVYYLENLGPRVTTQYSKQHLEPEKYDDV